jgi:hypothetical protein
VLVLGEWKRLLMHGKNGIYQHVFANTNLFIFNLLKLVLKSNEMSQSIVEFDILLLQQVSNTIAAFGTFGQQVFTDFKYHIYISESLTVFGHKPNYEFYIPRSFLFDPRTRLTSLFGQDVRNYKIGNRTIGI